MKMYSLACKDAGIPTCNYIAMGETKEEALKMSKEHMMKVHSEKAKEMMDSMTDEELNLEMEKHIKEKDEEM